MTLSTRRTAAPGGRALGLGACAAAGLVAASAGPAWAQLCECAEPGWMNCAIMGFSSHEPATAAFPQCMAHGSYERQAPAASDESGEAPLANDSVRQQFRPGAGRRAQPYVRRGAVIRPSPSRAPAVQPHVAPVAPSVPPAAAIVAPALDALAGLDFDPTTSFQIQPLNCPRGAAPIGATFYGGTRCGPTAPAAKATGIPAPVASAVAAVAAALDGADDESASDDNPPAEAKPIASSPASPASVPSSPLAPPPSSPMSPLPEPPPPSQAAAANALNADMAKSNWSVSWPVAASAGLVVGVPVGVAAFAIRRYGLTLIPW